MIDKRCAIPNRSPQGVDESVAYVLTTTKWGSNPTNVVCKVYLVENDTNTDVSATTLTGSPTVNGDAITLPLLGGLTAEKKYKVVVRFTVSGNTKSAYFWVDAEE